MRRRVTTMTPNPIEIAIDTSVVRELHSNGPRAPAVLAFLTLARAGKVKLVVWSRLKQDVLGAPLAVDPIKFVEAHAVRSKAACLRCLPRGTLAADHC